MKRDYIPEAEGRFKDWQENFMKLIVANQAAWGLPSGKVSDLQTLQSDYEPKYKKANVRADAGKSDRKNRTESRKKYEKTLRRFVSQYIRYNDALNAGDKTALAVTVPDNTRTRKQLPDRAPDGRVQSIRHLSHKIRVVNPYNSKVRAKPDGVRCTRVYRCISEKKPADEKPYAMIGSTSTAFFKSKFEMSELGKRAWYILKYENTRGETGLPCIEFDAYVA